MPRSLFGRLLGTAVIAILAALLFAGFAIGHVLEHFVMQGLDERLDAQIDVVARAVRRDGTIDARRAVDLPPFDQPGSGWSWQVRAPGGVLRSRSIGTADITRPAPPGPPPFPMSGPIESQPHPFEGRDPSGLTIHGRALTVNTTKGPAEILAAGPRAVAERPLREAMAPLLLSLLALGVALSMAILVQLRFGLRPIGRLRAMVAEVRAGRRTHVEASEPSELLPLIDELNALIRNNRTALEQARGHVANLAHGLKTPLAALRLDLTDPAPGELARHVDRIDAQIRHHLGRARAASTGGAAPATTLAPQVEGLVTALSRIHADRAITVDVTIGAELAVRCDPQDLDEMIGNLLDNAWKWAAASVRITAVADGRMVALRVEDDGPGIAESLLAAAVEPGRRLDERGDGHGFGLSITRELAELHGGGLLLANAAAAGLIATLRLPVAL
ncbi:ATP-binding protein [Sphingomonas sp. ASY06-1R]|uniref:ATP-binding protein n=1 Tax=Sphingomonas sp. ASY06-1R TaxID=3445771 RepID=UPI003FA23A51